MAEIVLIEDDDDDIYFFRKACQAVVPEAQLTVLKSGREFIHYVQNSDIAEKIYLVDLNMPQMGGFEALAKINTLENFKQMIVIMYTTSAREKDIRQAYKLGAKSYLLKPDNLAKIKELVQSTVSYWLKHNAHVGKELS